MMRLSVALLESLLVEREIHEVDKDWIDGVRAAWKQLAKEATTAPYPDDFLRPADPSTGLFYREGDEIPSEAFYPLSDAIVDRIKNVVRFLERLREDLLINKRFWTVPTKGGSAPEKSIIVRGLDKALQTANNTNRLARSSPIRPAGLARSDALVRFAGEGIEAIDKLLEARVWKTLRGLVKKAGGGVVSGTRTPFPENEINLGNAKLIFLDTPMDPYETKQGKRVTRGKEKWRSPGVRREIVKRFTKAYVLLKSRGLDAVWYGPMFILPETETWDVRYTVSQGALKGAKVKTTAAAAYNSAGDKLSFFSKVMSDTIIHELGHRYYYKVMNQSDRAEFDRWFGVIPAATQYGSRNPAEDFAEMFEEYVKGRMRLSSEQVMRFERVLHHKTKVDEPATVGELDGRKGRYRIQGVMVYLDPALREEPTKGKVLGIVGKLIVALALKVGFNFKKAIKNGISVYPPGKFRKIAGLDDLGVGYVSYTSAIEKGGLGVLRDLIKAIAEDFWLSRNLDVEKRRIFAKVFGGRQERFGDVVVWYAAHSYGGLGWTSQQRDVFRWIIGAGEKMPVLESKC